MSIKKSVEDDIYIALEQMERQGIEDKRITLTNLLNKYTHLDSCDYLLDFYDLGTIVSSAKGIMANKTFPCYIGKNKKRVFQEDIVSLCVAEATIKLINGKDCLKKTPKFDYRD